jgi:hypothetical protein
VPALFVLVTIYLIGFTLYNAPLLSLIGLAIILAGLPVYFYFSRKNQQQHQEVSPPPPPTFTK